jgi:signal transduction histidine kinase
VRLLRASEQAIAGPGGETERVVGVNLDITEESARAESFRKLNAQLQTRTAELEASVHELDAFAYSVSHDLRAPLRAIDGFSKILATEHRDHLNADGQRLLEVIIAETGRMGRLIDDLLAFSRMGRQKIEPSRINMEQMARDVFAELLDSNPDRRIEFRVSAIPPVMGTAPMLRQVWANLLDNAIKFTSRQNHPVIEVHSQTEPGAIVYTVTDNGAGFDMRHANKLFRVFQRLHGTEEFPGSGVGLALVERIIARHGGSVSATGSLGKGASFSFRLPSRPLPAPELSTKESAAAVLPPPKAIPPPQTDWPKCPATESGAGDPEETLHGAVDAQNHPMHHDAETLSDPDPPQLGTENLPWPNFSQDRPANQC